MSGRIVVSIDNTIVREVELTKPVTVVGRHPDCDIVIDHAAISGRHALFRVVNQTVYVEDLASTNGVLVNGLPSSRQVIHHLDLIEVGWHKLHYFDDSLLAGRLGNLEQTVHDDYERTRMAVAAEVTAPQPRPVVRDEDLSRTQLITAARPSRGPEVTAPRQAAAGTATATATESTLAMLVLSGPRTGERMPLAGSNTMLGVPGSDTALVVRRGRTYFLARLSGNAAPRLNAKPIGPGTHPIAEHDLIEVGALRYQVIQPLENP